MKRLISRCCRSSNRNSPRGTGSRPDNLSLQRSDTTFHMATHEPNSCPRCNQSFECKPGNITECQCFGIQFTEEEKKHISKVTSDCLCRNCLLELQQELRYENTRHRLAQMQAIMRGVKR